MRDRQNVAREAILSAGSLLRETFGRELSGEITEKNRNDFVTEIDTQSDRMLTETLTRVFPDIGILAEESGQSRTGETFWIIDPLDGTTNFIHGYPAIGVSIALVENGRVVLGLVYDPLREELFEAAAGGGAYCNGRPISVSSVKRLDDCLLGTGFPFRVHRHLDAYLGVFKDLFKRCRGIRRAGAAVLDLSHTAAGRLDGFWELYLRPWDMAAGGLIVSEAGGIVSDFFASSNYLVTGNIVAASPAVYDTMVETIQRYFKPEDIEDLRSNFLEKLQPGAPDSR